MPWLVRSTGGGAPFESDPANTIAFNGGPGVLVTGAGATGNTIQANALFANGGLVASAES